MKNNRTFFAIIVLMLSAQSFASAPAEQIEGQPGAVPPGGVPVLRVYDPARYCASASSSSVNAVKIYYDQSTQTEISATDNEQVIARVSTILKNSNKLIIKTTEKSLNLIEQQAQAGSMIHARALAKFKSLLESNYSLIAGDKILQILWDAQFLEKNNYGGYVINEGIREAYVAEGLIKLDSDSE